MANETTKQPILGNVSYDVAKDAVTIYIPALGVFYAAVAAIWGLPFSVEVVGTVAAVEVFLGAVLKVSSNRYQNLPVNYNGALRVNMTDPLSDNYKLELDAGWDSLAKEDEIRIQVIDESDPSPEYPEFDHNDGKD